MRLLIVTGVILIPVPIERMTMSNEGRLAYWKAKSVLCQKLFYEQVEDSTKQELAVENLARFIEANREIDKLTNGQGYAWIYGE